ncbi:MAG: FecR domain-containing protein [Candidatus Cyclobacteriaceae bacterium M3_2C_046]
MGRFTGRLRKVAFNYGEAIAWKDGILFFKKSTLDEVVSKLERWYGVQIVVSGSPVEPKVISGRFENESLENVMRSISFPEVFSFEIDGKKMN